ncbi:hypothetical protein DFH94DRAFT_321156 [Russula ochroleuca]|jgi:hypothetical protein|uniref:Uncharacterized protein n=1 Tax=Russula ochroleuca TaxID=152965 RepID=A0A9P5N1J7_9AGAM|nr:hypothetical protein DFH94DRAFT_321156 [Russula ochroleuca]
MRYSGPPDVCCHSLLVSIAAFSLSFPSRGVLVIPRCHIPGFWTFPKWSLADLYFLQMLGAAGLSPFILHLLNTTPCTLSLPTCQTTCPVVRAIFRGIQTSDSHIRYSSGRWRHRRKLGVRRHRSPHNHHYSTLPFWGASRPDSGKARFYYHARYRHLSSGTLRCRTGFMHGRTSTAV